MRLLALGAQKEGTAIDDWLTHERTDPVDVIATKTGLRRDVVAAALELLADDRYRGAIAARVRRQKERT